MLFFIEENKVLVVNNYDKNDSEKVTLDYKNIELIIDKYFN